MLWAEEKNQMPFRVLQSAPCSKACANCPNSLRSLQTCNEHTACKGYGTSANCPPLIVFAVLECARIALAAANLPAFGSMRGAHA